MKRTLSGVSDVLIAAAAIVVAASSVSRFRTEHQGGPSDEGRIIPDWAADYSSPRRVGRADAPVQLVVWTDYQCPACKQFERELESLRSQMGDSLSIVYRHFPLPNHPLAPAAAILADCALAQDRFPAMHSALFGVLLVGDSLPLEELAASAGIERLDRLRQCIADPKSSEALRADQQRGSAIGIRATPSFQVRDRLASGGRPAEDVRVLLERGSGR